MYVKNSNFAIYLVLAALVGFGISFLFLSSNVPGSLLSGDISKANVYSNQKDDPEFSLIEEKLKLLPDLPGSYQMKDKNGIIIALL